jgi:hypothetical protein
VARTANSTARILQRLRNASLLSGLSAQGETARRGCQSQHRFASRNADIGFRACFP